MSRIELGAGKRLGSEWAIIKSVARVDAMKTVNGKKLVLSLIFGSVIFTVVMGFGTYLFAKALAPVLQRFSHNKPDTAGPKSAP